MAETLVAVLKAVPATLEEFVGMQGELGVTPEGGAAMFVLALQLRRNDPDLGAACLAAAIDRSRLGAGDVSKRDLRRIDEQLAANAGLPAAYLGGATPANGYAVPELPWQLEMTLNPYSGTVDDGELKLFVACSGADHARPVTVRRQADGLWKPREWSSVLMGIRPPESA